MKKLKIIFKWILIVIVAMVVLFLAAIGIGRLVHRAKTKIETKNGIQESTYVELGGKQQYIQIRGEDKDNPIIIFLHGGPGSPMAFATYYYQTELESEYTFVSWDQRGCGRTYYKNKTMDVTTELSTDILVNDLDDLVEYLKDRFGKDQIILMGHSWGTILGSEYVRKYPEKVATYLGIGQVVVGRESAITSAKDAIVKAKEQNKIEDAKEIEEAISRLSNTTRYKDLDFENFLTAQRLSANYHGYEGAMSWMKMMWLGLSSPDMSMNDIRWYLIANNADKVLELQAPLMEDCIMNYDLYKKGNPYTVPTCFISGENDWVTPVTMVEEYCKFINQPNVTMRKIPDSGHSPFMDQPNEFSKIVREVLKK